MFWGHWCGSASSCVQQQEEQWGGQRVQSSGKCWDEQGQQAAHWRGGVQHTEEVTSSCCVCFVQRCVRPVTRLSHSWQRAVCGLLVAVQCSD